jgi:SAM-dependent methyltransferase
MAFVAVVVGLLAVLALIGLSLRALAVTGVPVYASEPAAMQAAFELLALKPGEKFADLGAGHGGVLKAVRRFADVEATGFELNPSALMVAAWKNRGDKKVRMDWRDSRRAELREFDAVYLYMLPLQMHAWAEKLKQLKPGARIVSVDFELPGWKAVEKREVGRLHQPIWLYVVGR